MQRSVEVGIAAGGTVEVLTSAETFHQAFVDVFIIHDHAYV